MDFLPILRYDDGCDGDGKENGERGGNVNGKREGQQRYSDQRFAKTEGRPDQGCNKNHQKNVQGCRVHAAPWVKQSPER
jgi:hypothetical protein